MKFKVGDIVKVSPGTGTIVWIRPRKILQDNNIKLPLVDGPNWEMGVMINNPPSCTFPFYIHYAWPEYAKLIKPKEERYENRKEISKSKGLSKDT
jgi:hypothetical protein